MNKKIIHSFLSISVLVFAFAPNVSYACDPKPHAKRYINRINDVLGGEKPNLVIEDGVSDKAIAFYDKETGIHIYRDDYEGLCVSNLPYLKSVIAHEYAHHISSKLKRVAWIAGRENVADVGEHAIASAIWGESVYFDGDLDEKYSQQYDKLLKYVQIKSSENLLKK